MSGLDIFLIFIAPVLLFIFIAGVIGFSLAYASEKIKIERDPLIDDVSRCLAGINCGGCGYAGCDDFAKALVAGETEIKKCNPTSKEKKNEIARILGKKDDFVEMKAVVHCNGGNKCKNKYDYQGYGDCQSAEVLAGGNKACGTGCMGLGSCAEFCSYGAIQINKDTALALVDKEKCTACGACLTACPKKIISRIPKSAKIFIACCNNKKGREVMDICENGCIACGQCVRKCPENAIELRENLAYIDYGKCTGCGVCVSVCPTKCILEYSKAV